MAAAGDQPPKPSQHSDSNASTHKSTRPEGTAAAAAQLGQQEVGNVAPVAAGSDPQGDDTALARAKELRGQVFGRLQADGRWKSLGLDKLRDDMFRECRAKGIEREAAMSWVYSELDRLYPPVAEDRQKAQIAPSDSENSGKQAASSQVADSGRVQGLGDLPPGWPELPANASLAAEIGWVQANRLYVVEELAAGGTRVRLDRAHEPAPSRAAIGWLETSIRSYAKFVEVAAKVSGTAQDEQAQVRAERMQVDEIRSLLAEML